MYSEGLNLILIAVFTVLLVFFAVRAIRAARGKLETDAVNISNVISVSVGISALCLIIDILLIVVYIIMQGLQ